MIYRFIRCTRLSQPKIAALHTYAWCAERTVYPKFCASREFGQSKSTMDYGKMVADMRDSFNKGAMRSASSRRNQLEGLRSMLVDNEDAFCDALHKDLHRSKFESQVFEIQLLTSEVTATLAELENWMKPTKVSRNMMQLMDSAFLHKDPLGVVMVIGTWNYPLQLLLQPAIGALAAGNCVVLKPSDLTANTERTLVELLPKYLDSSVCCAIAGDYEHTNDLLKNRFDHIFFTGSPNVGKIVMRAAVEHLTPTTLELGGKSPAIIDAGTDLATVARRICWGKFVNSGQICIAVDYILCVTDKKAELLEHLKSAVREFYGENPKESADYCRIVNGRNHDRLTKTLAASKATVVHGGDSDRDQLYFAPTILDNVHEDDAIMREEIFGPILPVMTVDSIDAAIAQVNKHEKPLALYLFSNNQANINRVMEETSSGAMVINDAIMHALLETLPFGGVGNSGMGRYHGKYSFDCFTFEKAVLHRSSGFERLVGPRYPPYSENKMSWLKRLSVKWRVPLS